MRLFVDTNLLVDLYMYFENFVEDVGFRRYITRVLDLLSGNCREVEDILISDVILREFSLKVIGSIIKSRIPIPRELEDRGFMGYVDERVNKIINRIGARLVSTDLSTLREVQDAYHSLMLARAGVKGKRVRRELVRDLLFLIQAVKNDALFLTRDEDFAGVLRQIAERNNWRVEDGELCGFYLLEVELRVEVGGRQGVVARILMPVRGYGARLNPLL